jgi:P4 family phage/plasmid primase-like protien
MRENNFMIDRGIVPELAAYIGLFDSFARDRSGRVFHYRDGVYAPDGEVELRRKVKQALSSFGKADRWSRSLASEVLEYVRLDAPELPAAPSFDCINLRNGMLNVWSGELKPHSPHSLSTVQIPIAYDSEARCPSIEAFVGEVFPADSTELAWEILGDLLTPDRSIQKAVCLVGEGGNGKGVFLQLTTNFIGPENVTHLSLQRLETDRFATANLRGKLANICADLPGDRLTEAAVFKAITGCDRITAEFKYQHPFEFTPFARLLFSANHLPATRDSSTAYFDRWLVLPFERRFRASNHEVPRQVLDARLSREKELSGALNRALPALQRLRRSGRFSATEATRRSADDLRVAGDPFALWLDRATARHPAGMISQERLYSEYAQQCFSEDRPVVTRQMFGRMLRRRRPDLQEAQRTVDGKRQWVYVGIETRL